MPSHEFALPKRGFTLIELLVVVAIIALLIAILLPALGRSRESARSSACKSNLHQLAIAGTTYGFENDGYTVPINSSTHADNGYTWGGTWEYGIRTDPVTSLFVADVREGYMGPYFQSPKVFLCPTISPTIQPYNFSSFTILPPASPYGMAALTATPGNASGSSSSCFKLAPMSAPTNTVFFGECLTYDTFHNNTLTGPSQNSLFRPGSTLDLAGIHNNMGNVAWYDGHVTGETPYYSTSANTLSGFTVQQVQAAKLGFLTPIPQSTDPAIFSSTIPTMKYQLDFDFYYTRL